MRTVTANFSGGQTFVATESLWQYDYGFVLVLQGLELPSYYEVHFSHTFTELADVNIGDANGVAIDDKFLRKDGYLFAWVYLHDEATDGYTKYQVKIPIAKRARPPEDPPTHEQQEALAQAITALNEETGRAEDAADRAEQAEANAKASEEAAEGYKDDAVDAKEDAQSAASTATQKAQEAAGSANVASRQAEIATNKALEASLSATDASGSASNAAVSETQAEISATAASNAETEAKNARDLAQGYATDANESKLAAVAAQGYAETAQGKAEDAQEAAEAAKESVEDMLEAFQSPTATAETLEPGSDATANYNGETGVFTFGIPEGEQGEPGTDGYSPSASVSQDGDVTTIAITDEDGTTTADIDLSDYAKDDELTELGHTKAPVITDTASGAIASFPDGADGMPVHKLVVNLSPQQDLHGYDSPWPAGGGKNVMPPAAAELQKRDGITVTSDGKGKYTCVGTATASVSFLFSVPEFIIPPSTERTVCFMNSEAKGIFCFMDGNTVADSWQLSSINRESEVYTVMAGKTCNKIRIDFAGGTTVNMTISPMFLAKNEDTSVFSPYSNICPISGWTGVTANRTGKNFVDDTIFYYSGVSRRTSGTGANELREFINSLPSGTYTVAFDAVVDAVGDSTKNWEFGFYGTTTFGTINSIINKVNPAVGSVYRPSVTINKPDGGVINTLYLYAASSSANDLATISKFQLELGSTATAYEEYRGNSYPVTFPSVNVWDEEYKFGYWDAGTGYYTPVNTELCSNSYIPVLPDTTYRGVGFKQNASHVYYDEDKHYIGWARPTGTFTTPANAKFITLNLGNVYGTEYHNDCSINYPSTITDYYAYGEPLTVYGGTLTIRQDGSGSVTITHRSAKIKDLSWTYGVSTYAYYYASAPGGKIGVQRNIYCDSYAPTDLGPPSAPMYSYSAGQPYISGGYCGVAFRDDRFNGDAATFKATMGETSFLYELATYIIVPLTAEQITTLKGQNNIWANGDSVEVEYCADTKLYIDKKLAALVAALS